MSFRIRPGRESDVASVSALVQSAYRGESSRPGWTTEAALLDGQRTDDDEVRSLVPHLLVAEEDREVVGCCTLVPAGGSAHFGMFAVRPSMQGSGIGAALLAAAEERALQLEMDAVHMLVLVQRTDLLPFYERRGYRPTGERHPFESRGGRFGIPRRDDLEFAVLRKVF